MNQPVYDRLIATARARSLVTYTDLAAVADLDLKGEQAIDRLGKILDEIALHEMRAGRPLLPVVVVRADSQMPSKGLFKFAKAHGLMTGKDDVSYFATELQRVYAAWDRHD